MAAGPATAGEVDARFHADINQAFNVYSSQVVRLNIDAEVGDAFQLDVPLNGEMYTLDLVPKSIRSDDYRLIVDLGGGNMVDVEPGPVRTMRGHVVGYPDSMVAASMMMTGFAARISFADGEQFSIQAVASILKEADPDLYVVYDSEQMLPAQFGCGVTDEQRLHYDGVDDGVGYEENALVACGADFCLMQLAADADVEYFNNNGANVQQVEDRIAAVINQVNVQYERDVEITNTITAIIVRTAEPDPYTSTFCNSLLNQITNYWNANHGNIQRDTAELFTHKTLQDCAGIAWLNVICITGSAYSVVWSDCCGGGISCASDLSAHEMGHNWSADHCNCANPNYTMNPSLTCANRFHPSFTIPQIIAFRNSRGCLTGVFDEPDPPGNDDCADRDSAGAGNTAFSTVGATEDGPDLPAECNEGDGVSIDNDVWYQHVSLCQTGFMEIDICNADFDTRVAVYTNLNCPVNNNRLVGCDDDGCGMNNGPSNLVVPVNFGGSYLIRIGGDEEGEGTFNISCVQQQGDDANIDDAKSLRTHNATELAIDLDDTSGIEPRQGGVSKLQVHMTEPLSPGTVNCGNVQINCAGGALACDSTSLTGGNRTVTVNVSGATAQADCCTFSFNGMETDSGGDVVDDYSVVIVEGDINFSGAVTGADPSLIKPHFGEVAGVDLSAPEFDFDVSGAVTGGDFSLIKTRLGNAAPACP